jgi:hypothetical protein
MFADQVQPAAVQELAGDERRRLLRQDLAGTPRIQQLGRDDAPLVTNASRLASDVACNPSSQANTTKQTR